MAEYFHHLDAKRKSTATMIKTPAPLGISYLSVFPTWSPMLLGRAYGASYYDRRLLPSCDEHMSMSGACSMYHAIYLYLSIASMYCVSFAVIASPLSSDGSTMNGGTFSIISDTKYCTREINVDTNLQP